MDHINPVREQIGHRTAAKVPEPAPAVEFLFTERLIRRAAQPLFPIQRLRIYRLCDLPRMIVLPPVRPDLRHSPQAPSLNQVHRVPEMTPAALLHAALKNSFVGAHCTY